MTPLVKLENFYLKREDLNITGSVKDRSLPLQIDNLIKSGYTSAVISSTGNAAISAQYFCNQKNIDLKIFVSTKINPDKLKQITNPTLSPQPISDAVKYSKTNHSYLLRQSTDPVALIGYQVVAVELLDQIPQITSIFIPIGSGTTLLGISQKLPPYVKIFGVQSAFNPTITKHFQPQAPSELTNLTDALTVRFLPLKKQILAAIKNSQGQGITISNQDILSGQKFLESQEIFASPEAALTYSAYLKAKELAGAYPVLLITGIHR